MARDNSALLEAKRRLYGLLLTLTDEELTMAELDLMVALACDKQIQGLLGQSTYGNTDGRT